MGIVWNPLWRTFGVPTGLLGRLGGKIMSGSRQRMIAAHVADLLDVRRGDRVLEIGFGPGIGIQCVSERLAGEGVLVGIDPSDVMIQMAGAQNAGVIEKGIVTLVRGTVQEIPYDSGFFDKAYAMNTYQIWPDKRAGLREIRRVLKPGGRLVLSAYGPAKHTLDLKSVRQQLKEAGFQDIAESEQESVVFVTARS